MSHGTQGKSNPDDLLPPARVTGGLGGITGGVLLLLLAGILCSAMQGTFVVMASPTGRVWPAADSAKIPLPPKTF
jgi:hypothetical protein